MLETADELGRLERDDICEIIRLVMVESQTKEEGGTIVSKQKEKSMASSNTAANSNNNK